MKEIGKIYEETNYGIFRRLPDNRDVTQGRINKLVASFKERSILNPLIVNEKMEIIDGQGRYEARKFLGLPIQFIIIPNIGSDECKLMNRYNTSWTLKDFCISYAKSGNENYRRLIKAADDAKCSLADALMYTGKLINKGGGGNGCRKAVVERGELNFTIEDARTTKDVADHLRKLRAALSFNKLFNETMKRAISIIYRWEEYNNNGESYNADRMIAKCEQNRSSFIQTGNLNSMIAELERIYNYRQPSNTKIYFTDYMRNKGSNVRDYMTSKPTAKNTEDRSTLKKR